MGSPAPPIPTHAGLGNGTVALLIFLAVFTFYCALGVTARVQQGENSCPGAMPHHEFWLALPGGIAMCLGGICALLCKAAGQGYRAVSQQEDAPMQDIEENCAHDDVPEAS